MNRHPLTEVSYYLLLFFLVLFTLGTAYFVMPLILVLGTDVSYLVLLILGIAFGLLIAYFVFMLDNITHHHHAGVWIVILFGSLLNFLLVYLALPKVVKILEVNPIIAGLLFSVSFMIPYLVLLLREAKK